MDQSAFPTVMDAAAADAAAAPPVPFQHPVPAVLPAAQLPAAPGGAAPEPDDFEPPESPDRRDAYAVTAFGDVIDRAQHAAIARLTMGLSPTALTEAYLDWAIHLASQPGKRLQLIDKAMRKSARLAFFESITVEVLNPKTAIFFMAFLPQFIDVSAAWPVWLQLVILGTIVNLMFSSADIVCVFLAGLVVGRLRQSSRAQRLMRRAGGTLLVGLGVHVALQRN